MGDMTVSNMIRKSVRLEGDVITMKLFPTKRLKTFAEVTIRALYPLIGLRFIYSRAEFPYVLNSLGLLGEGAEVGVQRGTYSHHLLTVWNGKVLHCIDPWRAYQDEEYQDLANVSQGVQDERLAETADRLREFGGRANILRVESLRAVGQFREGQLDFVYLDARHDYDSLREDIRAWAPKIRCGGILCGHDYIDGDMREGQFGVKTAVDEFAANRNLRLHTSHEPEWRSWFIRL